VVSALLPVLLLNFTVALQSEMERPDMRMPDELKGISIEEKPGALMPENLNFKNHKGEQVVLKDYLHDGRPLVLVLAYYSCPTLCTFVLNEMVDGLSGVAWNIGDKYRFLVVSIDPRDTPETADAKRANYLKKYGRDVYGNGWDFLMGDEASVRKLADAVGFHYRWDDKTQQYAHAAGGFLFTPEGVLSRTLYGLNFDAKNLRLGLLEASEGKLGSAWEKVLLFCFHYDPNARSYVLAASRVMRVGGVLTMTLLGFLLFRLWRKESQRPVHKTAERTS